MRLSQGVHFHPHFGKTQDNLRNLHADGDALATAFALATASLARVLAAIGAAPDELDVEHPITILDAAASIPEGKPLDDDVAAETKLTNGVSTESQIAL